MQSFAQGFDDDFNKIDVSFMMSDGGLCPIEAFNGSKAIFSGPAGGIVGYLKLCVNVVGCSIEGIVDAEAAIVTSLVSC